MDDNQNSKKENEYISDSGQLLTNINSIIENYSIFHLPEKVDYSILKKSLIDKNSISSFNSFLTKIQNDTVASFLERKKNITVDYLKKQTQKNELGVLKNVQIEKLWGTKNLDVNLSKINLFIGKNGTGKTTFIRIIESILNHNIEALNNIKFKKCKLTFDNGFQLEFNKNKIDNIESNDKTNDYYFYIEKYGKRYFYENSANDFYVIYTDEQNEKKIYNKYSYNIKSIIDNLVKLSWIPLDRKDISTDEKRFLNEDTINEKLKLLSSKILRYKSKINVKENEILNTFRNKIFELMLYDDEIDGSASIKIENKHWEEQFKKAFRDLGITSNNITNKIDIHINKIKKELQDNDNSIANNILVSLFNRSQKIVKFSLETEKEIKKINTHLDKYIEIINSYIDKNIDGFFDFNKKLNQDLYNYIDLSSGEKQILILLTEAFLQNNSRYLYIIDEPELSLHISWQKEIVSSISRLNPNAQIIFATHSPEIVAKWNNFVIDMEDIIK